MYDRGSSGSVDHCVIGCSVCMTEDQVDLWIIVSLVAVCMTEDQVDMWIIVSLVAACV